MTYMGDRGREIFETLDWAPSVAGQDNQPATPAENETLTGVFDRFERYVRPKKNVIKATVEFHGRAQREGEPFNKFLTDLRVLVKRCEYDDEDRMLRDAIVVKTKEHKVREKCLDAGDELTLEKAISIALNYETSQESLKVMGGGEAHVHKIKHVNKTHKNKTAPPTYKGNKRDSSTTKCNRCGYSANHEQCPAMGRTCSKCDKPNHFAAVCKTKLIKSTKPKQRAVRQITHSSSDEENEYTIGAVTASINSSAVYAP
ncbi:uncharacterized protein LOC117125180 [Anneissia japonica]|uniref:uncharacterized protein LOC117125180 n=1 Tax=Anneissia japonica TaxID=1529436 RepID=UPI00142578B6|nr:uncharacterized protein LOC117125180 [Anneissia japonica]